MFAHCVGGGGGLLSSLTPHTKSGMATSHIDRLTALPSRDPQGLFLSILLIKAQADSYLQLVGAYFRENIVGLSCASTLDIFS